MNYICCVKGGTRVKVKVEGEGWVVWWRKKEGGALLRCSSVYKVCISVWKLCSVNGKIRVKENESKQIRRLRSAANITCAPSQNCTKDEWKGTKVNWNWTLHVNWTLHLAVYVLSPLSRSVAGDKSYAEHCVVLFHGLYLSSFGSMTPCWKKRKKKKKKSVCVWGGGGGGALCLYGGQELCRLDAAIGPSPYPKQSSLSFFFAPRRVG